MERDQAIRFVHDLLRLLLTKKGSDLFLTAEFPPAFKVDGRVLPVSNQPLTAQHTAELVRSIMNDRQAAEFESAKECNFAINPTGIGRFRVSAFVQQGKVGIVFRVIADRIPTVEELNLPPLISELSMAKRGIVLVVGATGSGKSTTMAAMVGYRNENSQGHIITIEDPIEFLHRNKNCLVNQREVGGDTRSFGNALKSVLRQDPDVVLVGEMRDLETIEAALTL
ncbi:MAG: ATPase, T2SS/T4P/T4SS family, partial [Betaproteobacteria bacterium]